MTINEIASAVYNDLWGGNVIPPSSRSLISLEQLEDEAIELRQSVIKEFYTRGLLSLNDVSYSINCIEVDCKDPNRCPCKSLPGKPVQHFEIPRLVDGLGTDAIIFIGSTDRAESFRIYSSLSAASFQRYRRRNANVPYVYIDKTPNENGKWDG